MKTAFSMFGVRPACASPPFASAFALINGCRRLPCPALLGLTTTSNEKPKSSCVTSKPLTRRWSRLRDSSDTRSEDAGHGVHHCAASAGRGVRLARILTAHVIGHRQSGPARCVGTEGLHREMGARDVSGARRGHGVVHDAHRVVVVHQPAEHVGPIRAGNGGGEIRAEAIVELDACASAAHARRGRTVSTRAPP